MRRLPGWRSRMEKFIDQVKASAFDWGDFDCGPNWVGRHVEVMTGVDLTGPYRGDYSDAAGALRLIRKAGFKDLGDLVSFHLQEIHPSRARLGDIMAFASETPIGCSLGICNGERVLVLGEKGVVSVDRLAAVRAWRVGDA